MKKSRKRTRRWPIPICCLLALALVFGVVRYIQSAAPAYAASDSSGDWGVNQYGAVAQSQVTLMPDSAAEETLVSSLNESDAAMAMPILSDEALAAAMTAYGISADSSAAAALSLINSQYAALIPESQRTQPLLFFFEGAGSSADPTVHYNALGVLIQNGIVTYLSLNCTTIPDAPFTPWKNGGTDMPTVKSGIYQFDTVNHKGSYAALRILQDQVVRFHSQTEFYEDVSNDESIQIHRRITEELAPEDEAWGNSVGCILVGNAGEEPEDEYATFIQTIGIVPAGSAGTARFSTSVTGLVVVDRSLGTDYLRAVGYSDEAIALLG